MTEETFESEFKDRYDKLFYYLKKKNLDVGYAYDILNTHHLVLNKRKQIHDQAIIKLNEENILLNDNKISLLLQIEEKDKEIVELNNKLKIKITEIELWKVEVEKYKYRKQISELQAEIQILSDLCFEKECKLMDYNKKK